MKIRSDLKDQTKSAKFEPQLTQTVTESLIIWNLSLLSVQTETVSLVVWCLTRECRPTMEPLLTNQTLNSAVNQCLKDTGYRFVCDFLSLFYIISPFESTHGNPYDVPDYEVTVSITWPAAPVEVNCLERLQLLPVFGALLVIEAVLRYFQRKDIFRVTDLVVNLGSASLFILMR